MTNPPPPAPRKVNVTVNCTDAEIRVTVNPWSVHLVQEGQEIEWISGDPSQTITIAKDNPGDEWPYNPPGPPYRGNQAHPPKGSGLKKGNKGKTFPYKISVDFTDPQGKPRTVVIDPDMVVDV